MGWLLLACSVLLVVEGVVRQRRARQFIARSVPIRGRIVEIVSDSVNEDWEARTEFVVDGQRHVVGLRSWGKIQVGQEVALRCLPSDPSGARRDYPGFVWKEVVAFHVIAAALAVVAILRLLRVF